ncbi:DUF4942 domain-containing protein [Tardiphaga sp. 862_B3_N1_1]|uniref:DUF4942 domain-containing protein n=1 Tax=Tardiphaga sp. 862_B3_N1_1 TaxID=3240763 RepID=UPI003F8B237F
MNAVVHSDFELVDDAGAFFAPVSSDLVDSLIGQYQQARKHIDQLAGIVAGDLGNVLHYFIEGNAGDDRMHRTLYVDRLFEAKGAIGALNAAYWSKALNLTDVLDCMPQKRRDEWFEQIKNPLGKKKDKYDKGYSVEPLPEFTEETVRSTLISLMTMRQQFFSERVDGIFRALSRDHVTNVPEGFSKRMILNYVVNSYGHAESSTCGYINDLRCVVAKFMGRDEPKFYATSGVVDFARGRPGEWVTLDGGALRLRVYKKGTGHLEIHPEMAWRLNQILANLHPAAIPSEFRTKPKRKAKEFKMMGRPLPFAVLSILSSMRRASERSNPGAWPERYRDIPNALRFDYHSEDKAAKKEAERVLEAIGGAWVQEGRYFQFPYAAGQVISEIVASGCIPDQQSHQFYPTPADVGAMAVALADIGPDHSVLEPEAGQGNLADLLPMERTTCVEISPLHCEILRAKGYTDVMEADFIALAAVCEQRFDRVVMNPPFDQGRAKAHTEAAFSLLAPGGVLVAVLPAGMRGKDFLPDCETTEWSPLLENRFAGTSVAVCLMKVRRAA